jgi:ParB-like chromosome segregation protein Spo0J
MDGLKIIYKDPVCFKLRASYPRTQGAKQIKQIAASIQQFGFISRILIDANDGIIVGHGRVDAAKLLSMHGIPTIAWLI